MSREETESLIDYLITAVHDWLEGRDLEIITRRFGLESDGGETLQQIANTYDISRERIRQLQFRALRRIVSRGHLQIRNGNHSDSCAQLVQYVKSRVQIGTPGEIERLAHVIWDDLAHLGPMTQAYPLIAYLAGGKKAIKRYRNSVRQCLSEYIREQQAEAQQQKHIDHFLRLLEHVVWPAKASILMSTSFSRFSAQRQISEDGQGHTGAFFSAKLNRMVEYESSLEMRFLQQLDVTPAVVFYQEQPLQIPYVTQTKTSLYYPDVFFVLGDGRAVVAEIKPPNGMALQSNWIKWAALKEYCRQQGYGFLITNSWHSLQEVGRREIRDSVRTAVLSELNQRLLTWPAYKKLRESCGITTAELHALIIQERLIWQLGPFRLSLPQQQ